MANMVADKAPQPTSRDEFEIAIVCTKALEYDAVCLLLDDFWDTGGDPFGRARGDPNTYTTGCMGKYNIVVVLLCNSGKATAAGATASLRSSYPCIELLILAGICEGVPDAHGEELLLGDVVISETVIQYDLGSQFTNAFKEKNTLEGRLGRANKNIRSFTTNMKTEIGYQRLEEKVSLYLEQIQNRASSKKYQRRRRATIYIYPGSANDILFESTHCHRHYNSSQCVCANYNPDEDFYAVCDESRNMDCEQTGCKFSPVRTRDRLDLKNMLENDGDLKSAQIPSIFFGRFGSGDTAFSSGIHRDSLAKKHNIIAFEMEGAGVWDELPCIIVKGVSDYGDGHKTKNWAQWQNFAAASAASVARALIERYPQTDKSPATKFKRQENKACLDALFITNPEHDKQRIEETKGGLLLDAYTWIIRTEEFTQWLEDPETRLLLIKGDPGKGKTMLLCGIINELKATNPGRNVYYFLCQAADVRLNNATAIFRGLLHMMAVQQPSLISYIREDYDRSGKSVFEDRNSCIILSRMFENILRDGSVKEPIFIIDALDECLTDLSQLLEMIVKSSSSFSQVKWLVSSRNEADIREALTAAEHKSTVSLELNAESVSAAITIYIRHKVQLLSKTREYKESTRIDIEKYLCDNANGTFLWVALVCALLEKAPRSDPLPKSAEFPPGLDQLYERMINRVCAQDISDLGRRVLAIATLARQPLTEQEFVSLIYNYDGGSSISPEEYIWEDILGHCGSFLTIRNRTVYFVHQSAKDFIVKHAIKRLFPNGTEYVHGEILEASISVMESTLRKDMYGLVDHAASIHNLPPHIPGRDSLTNIRYFCTRWIDHFEQSIPKNKSDSSGYPRSQELVSKFLRENFLYWLEALSLLGSIVDGIAGMERLKKSVANAEMPGLLVLALDAHRFIQKFANAISDFPLQVYVSGLIFSPTQSIIRQQFRKVAPEWIQSLPNGEVEWPPWSRIYESNKEISHLSTSCCGTWVASIFFDATITIWDTNSGKITRLFDARPDIHPEEYPRYGPGGNRCVCFSPWNGEELASSWFRDNRVIIWDVKTGKISQQFWVENELKSSSYLVSAANLLGCLSNNYAYGITVASIWNTKTGQCIKRVPWQITDWLTLFSPADENILARSERYNDSEVIRIFDLDTGNTIHTVEYGSRIHVRDMKFSSDGSFLAIFTFNSRDEMGTVSLADAVSGGKKWSFRYKDATDPTLVSAFSADGRLLAIATIGGIHIFNAVSGKCLRKFMMKSKCLVFSSDGRKLFSADDLVINVIEVGIGSFIEAGAGDSSDETKIAERFQIEISPDGKLVASVFKEPRIIEITDAHSGITTHILRGLDDDEYWHPSILFSPDFKKVVVAQDRMMLWDISSKPANVILSRKSTFFRFCGVAGTSKFSSDSNRLATTMEASESPMFRINVWDANSGRCLMELGKREDAGDINLEFSPDNRLLAISRVAYRSKSIRVEIWDIASGSALQALDLEYCRLHCQFHVSSLQSNSCSSFDKEDGEDEETDDELGSNIFAMSFHGESHLVLHVMTLLEGFHTAIRVVLRRRMDRELADEAITHTFFPKPSSFSLDETGTWIEFNREKLVWVPPQYRNSVVDFQGSCFALSRVDGPVSIVHFRESVLIQQRSSVHTSIGELMPSSPENDLLAYMTGIIDCSKIEHHNMKLPDDKMLEKMDSFAVAKYNMSITRDIGWHIFSDLKAEFF